MYWMQHLLQVMQLLGFEFLHNIFFMHSCSVPVMWLIIFSVVFSLGQNLQIACFLQKLKPLCFGAVPCLPSGISTLLVFYTGKVSCSPPGVKKSVIFFCTIDYWASGSDVVGAIRALDWLIGPIASSLGILGILACTRKSLIFLGASISHN